MGTFLVLFGAAFVIPGSWGLRVGIAAVLAFAGLIYLSPIVPWEEAGRFEGLGMDIARLAVLAVLGGIFLRMILDFVFQRPILYRDNPWLRWFDFGLALVAGALVGTAVTLVLAVSLRGAPGGLGLNLTLAAAFGGMTVAPLLRHRGLFRSFLAAACLAVASLIGIGALTYPKQIAAAATVPFPEHPRCLRTPAGEAPSVDEMRLLTLPRALPRLPNLTLTVMLPEGPKHFRWSYRSFRFRSVLVVSHGACPPATALP